MWSAIISNGSALSFLIHSQLQKWLYTLWHPTQHNEYSSAALPCPWLCLAVSEMVHSLLLILPGGVTGRLIRLPPACLPSEWKHRESCVRVPGFSVLCSPRQLVAEWSLWLFPSRPFALQGWTINWSIIKIITNNDQVWYPNQISYNLIKVRLILSESLWCYRDGHTNYVLQA